MTLDRRMKKFVPIAEENNKKLLSDEMDLILTYDNVQSGQQRKKQRNMKSNDFNIGTFGFAVRPRKQVLPNGTVLSNKRKFKFLV